MIPMGPDRMRRSRGFTLLELTIVALLVGILAATGVYTYRRMLVKARMSQATVVLQHLLKAETLYYGDKDVYTDNITHLDFNPVKYDYYRVSVATDNIGKNFTGTAVGIGPMEGDRWFVTRDNAPWQDNTSPFFR
jgi:type IV pilus assembly protein PilE